MNHDVQNVFFIGLETMQTLVQVLRAEGRSFKSPKNNKISKRCICQCIVHSVSPDGVAQLDVGVLVVPEKLCPVPAVSSDEKDVPDVPAGEYFAEYGLAIHWETKELGGVLKALTRRDPKPVAKQEAPKL